MSDNKLRLDKNSGGAGFPIRTTKKPLPKWYEAIDNQVTYEKQKQNFRLSQKRLSKNAAEKCFMVDGEELNRFDMFEHILILAFEGFSLPKILATGGANDVLPTPREIKRWCELHPDFGKQLSDAEKYRAEIQNDVAVDTVMDLRYNEECTKEDIAKAKLIKETLVEQAGFGHDKFQPKSKQQIEDITNRDSIEQVHERIRETLKAVPQLDKSQDVIDSGVLDLDHTGWVCIDVEVEEQESE